MKKLFKNKKVWLLSALSFVLGAGLSAGVFHYKGQFNASFVERQSTNKTLSETDDYKIQTQMKVAERTPQSKLRSFRSIKKMQKKMFKQERDRRSNMLTNSENYTDTEITARSFSGKNFRGVSFKNTVFLSVDMKKIDFTEADFEFSKLIWSPRYTRHGRNRPWSIKHPLKGAKFDNANFQNAVIHSVDLRDVSFKGTKMQGAEFRTPEIRSKFSIEPEDVRRVKGYSIIHNNSNAINAMNHPEVSFLPTQPPIFYWPDNMIPKKPHFQWVVDNSTDFRGAYLQWAYLKELKDLHLARLDGAVYNRQTTFPDGFDPQKYGMIRSD